MCLGRGEQRRYGKWSSCCKVMIYYVLAIILPCFRHGRDLYFCVRVAGLTPKDSQLLCTKLSDTVTLILIQLRFLKNLDILKLQYLWKVLHTTAYYITSLCNAANRTAQRQPTTTMRERGETRDTSHDGTATSAISISATPKINGGSVTETCR